MGAETRAASPGRLAREPRVGGMAEKTKAENLRGSGVCLLLAGLVLGMSAAFAQSAPVPSPSKDAIGGGRDVNVWSNALFGGAGAAGRVVNGNVSILGSATLLGDALEPWDLAISAMDITHTSLMFNGPYLVIPPALRARIPDPPTVVVGGETLMTLGAVLRVKRGLVLLSGNASVGEDYPAVMGWKPTVDGTYVTSGWFGNAVTPDGGRGIPRTVFSDNGWNELYDLGEHVTMPRLSDDWRERNGARVMNPATGTWYTHEDYFSQVLLGDPANPGDGVYAGDIVLDGSKTLLDGFYWNATTGEVVRGIAVRFVTLNPEHDYLWFDPAPLAQPTTTSVLKVNGQLRIDGNLTFTGNAADKNMFYSGRCAVLVMGDVTCDVNLLSCNNGDPTDTVLSYPIANCLGIMSSQQVLVGLSSQIQLTAVLYAWEMLRIYKWTVLLGAVASNYFDMFSQVPIIVQVPVLSENLPEGMIANYPIRPPQPPDGLAASPVRSDGITWTWRDNSLDETGFKVLADPGAAAPVTLRVETPADTASWDQSGLAPNTQHSFLVHAFNDMGFRAGTPHLTAWTLALSPAVPVVGNPTGSSLDVAVGAGDGNPEHTEYALYSPTSDRWVGADNTLGETPVWRTAADWGTATVTGLAEYRTHAFQAVARNGDRVETEPGPAAQDFVPDLTPPTGAVAINGGATHTMSAGVTLGLSYEDGAGSGVAEMQFSPDGETWGAWEPAALERSWTLDPGDGAKTAHVRFRDAAGNLSPAASAAIVLDQTPPGVTLARTAAFPTPADTLTFTVVFSEPVSPPLEAAHLGLSGTLDGEVAVSGTGVEYVVTLTLADPFADGTVGVTLPAGLFADAAGNPCPEGVSDLCTVRNWPGFAAAPADVRLYAGDSPTLRVAVAEGGVPTAYQWKRDTGEKTVSPGPASPQWTLESLSPSDAGAYWCEVDFGGETHPTSAVTLDVRDHLSLAGLPPDRTVTEGTSVPFAVTASGGYAPLRYLWRKDGTELPGLLPEAAAFTLASVVSAHSGDYSVEVSDDNGEVAQSPSVRLTVEENVPAAGLLGAVGLAALLALAGRRTLSR